MFISYDKVRMHDTDMTGFLYFPRQFRFVHDALEEFVASAGLSFDQVFHKEDFGFVIVHAEADYLVPLRVGDDLEIHLKIDRIGTTSFNISYDIYKTDKTLVGTAKTIHVTIDKEKRVKIPLPKKVKAMLEKHFVGNDGSD